MIVSITLLIVAIASAITAYYSSKRMDKLQEQIDSLEKQIKNLNLWSSSFASETEKITTNLDKQIKSQYSHFTSRIDKTRNDVLQNTRQY